MSAKVFSNTSEIIAPCCRILIGVSIPRQGVKTVFISSRHIHHVCWIVSRIDDSLAIGDVALLRGMLGFEHLEKAILLNVMILKRLSRKRDMRWLSFLADILCIT